MLFLSSAQILCIPILLILGFGMLFPGSLCSMPDASSDQLQQPSQKAADHSGAVQDHGDLQSLLPLPVGAKQDQQSDTGTYHEP